MRKLLLVALAFASANSFAALNKAQIESNSVSDLDSDRLDRLERAVEEIQKKLQNFSPCENRVAGPWSCTVQSTYADAPVTYLAKSNTRIEAEQQARNLCVRQNIARFCGAAAICEQECR